MDNGLAGSYHLDASRPLARLGRNIALTAISDPASSTITTIFGATISGTIDGTSSLTPMAHTWVADASGLYQTQTDLALEWQGYYKAMLAGGAAAAGLTDIQRLEGNAEAVFENTGLKNLSAATQQQDREDVQREFDAISAAMTLDGISDTQPLTEQSYLQISQTIQGNATLEELAMQGHGLNNSGISRYSGYSNDFQNNVDNTTYFVGGGALNNNGKAIADFFDDNGLSHICFAVIEQNGQLVQLNQNGAAENTLNQAIIALNDSMYYRVYTSADFSTHKATAATNKASNATFYTQQDATLLAALEKQEAAPAPAGDVKTLFGADIANTMTFNDGNGIIHVWTANAQGLFVTTTNLAAEWHKAYVDLVTTGGADLTAEQRLEANAEAVFENTGLKNLSAAQQQLDREDAQREFDAEFAAMKQARINPNATITPASYLLIEHTLQSNAALEELAIQGHGLNDPPSSKYSGYTNDFQNNVDDKTLFEGGGLDNGQSAVRDFFDDAVMTHTPFPVVVINGKLVQLNQNGGREQTLAVDAAAMNRTIHLAAYDAADFKHPAAA